ncbi:MAG: terminase family protein, partial [Lachnospiraceae bacterium]|nr:terminase family protein [Lachnospiraceae bacterium]
MNTKSVKEIEEEKSRKIMNIVAWKAGYFRSNPHRFVSEVLFAGTNFRLRLFQKILLVAMVHYNFCMYLAARGQGKSYLTALFCCVRCILWPKTQIVITSGTLKQANEVLLKIQDIFMPQSVILRSEIKSCNVGQNDASIYFWNGSYIKTRTSSHNSRSARANIVICDEFRMIDKTIIDQVLKKFLSDPRHPGYIDRPEYAHLQERNKEIYMSSCWLKSHWSWEKCRSYTASFLDDTKKYFIAALPYQLSVMEGLLMRSQLEDEMAEEDFDLISFQMEMECFWFGDTDGSLFQYDDISKVRKIKNAFMPLKFYT